MNFYNGNPSMDNNWKIDDQNRLRLDIPKSENERKRIDLFLLGVEDSKILLYTYLNFLGEENGLSAYRKEFNKIKKVFA